MPLYHYRCDGPEAHEVRRVLTVAEAKALDPSCPKCSGKLVRAPKPPTSNVVERLDNGVMARAVERPADAERLFQERALADTLRRQNE